MNQSSQIVIVPFVLSLVGFVLVFALSRFPFVGLILGIIALVLSVGARKTQPGPVTTASFILSILVICIGSVQMIAWIACIGMTNSIAGYLFGSHHGLPRLPHIF